MKPSKWYRCTNTSDAEGKGGVVQEVESRASIYHELLASVTLLVLTEPCEFLVHGCVVNFCNPGLDLAEITVKATVKDYR